MKRGFYISILFLFLLLSFIGSWIFSHRHPSQSECSGGFVDRMKPYRNKPSSSFLDPSRSADGIILISIDTLRADCLGAYGNSNCLTPNLDRLSQKAILFVNPIVQLPGTLPSHMSIFTSTYPFQHEVYPPDGMLSHDISTLPEMLSKNDFYCCGVTEGGFVSGRFGFSRGFDDFYDESKDIEETVNWSIDFLSKRPKGKRFFLFMHSYQVHDPYFPPTIYRDILCPDGCSPSFAPTGSNLSDYNRGRIKLENQDAEYLKLLYLAEVKYTDHVLLRLFQFLQDMGLSDRVLLILTSDHGEEFMEHGKLAHEQIYQPLLHVPMLSLTPGWSGQTISKDMVESVDILPSILQFFHLPPHQQCQGQSLFANINNVDFDVPSYAYSQSFVSPQGCLIEMKSDRMKKVIQFVKKNGRSDSIFIRKKERIIAVGDTMELICKAYHRSRKVVVKENDIEIASFRVWKWWKRKIIPLPGSGSNIHYIDIECDSCDVPSDISDSRDDRCLSIAIQKTASIPLTAIEYYDLSVDPGEKRNLYPENPKLYLELSNSLNCFFARRKFIDAPLTAPLSTKIKDQLQALGYLE